MGVQNGLGPAQNVNNGSTLEDAANGVEFSGGHMYQGYITTPLQQCLTRALPESRQLLRNIGPQNGVSFNSDANFKDLYGRLVYRFSSTSRRTQRAATMSRRAGYNGAARSYLPSSGNLLLLRACNAQLPSAACRPMA